MKHNASISFDKIVSRSSVAVRQICPANTRIANATACVHRRCMTVTGRRRLGQVFVFPLSADLLATNHFFYIFGISHVPVF